MERYLPMPDNSKIIKGEIADYFLDADGILYSYSKNPRRTVENISRNIELVKKITGNKQVPLLIYMCDSPVPDKETRKFSTQQLPNIYSAMAMVGKPGLTLLVMKILYAIIKPPIPTKSFTDDRDAKKWLQQFL